MENIPLGVSSLLSSRLGYGCWRLAGTWNPDEVTPENESRGRKAVITAFESGYTLFDNADIYCHGVTERIFGDVLKQVAGMRERVIVATKCGIRFAGDPDPDAPARYDFSASHILRSCEASLKRMGIETIDLYQLHRPDYLANPAEIAEAFTKLKQAGKVRYFGVSNFRPTLVTALQVACPMPLVVHQVEISLAKLDCFTDGTLDQCSIESLTPLAWSPLARGLLGTGESSFAEKAGSSPVTERIAPVLDTIARARGAKRTSVALAWLLKHPAKIVPIIGSTNPERIREAVQATALELTREEWYRLLIAARGERLP
ncbi:MAG TPA: aldo/keto reductase [Verrucomicrobiae bacterium]|jgi:predicted oxidoreductase|nr:aldo/keto reductase [Verrucomicrobiae bacterium]